MNHLRDTITDPVIEFVFVSFPSMSDQEFRAFTIRVLGIAEFAVNEVMKDERHMRSNKNLNRPKT